MFKRRVSVLLPGLLLLSASNGYAQEARQVGITMGYPAHVGLIWHATEKIAVRPEVNFSAGNTDIEGIFDEGSSSSWSYGIGVSALFYLKQWEGLRTYVAPRFTYFKGESTVELSGPFFGESVSRISSFGLAGLFGAQYSLHPRFSVFGEVGLAFTDRDSTSSLSEARTDSSTWGTTTGVGVVFYF